jgi:hypothetical protein
MREKANNRLERVEQMLRQYPATALAPDFRERVMDRVRALPANVHVVQVGRRRDWLYSITNMSSGEKFGALLILVALTLPLLPGAADWLAAIDYSLQTVELTLVLGSLVLSASLLSAAIVIVLTGLLAALGIINARYRVLA